MKIPTEHEVFTHLLSCMKDPLWESDLPKATGILSEWRKQIEVAQRKIDWDAESERWRNHAEQLKEED